MTGCEITHFLYLFTPLALHRERVKVRAYPVIPAKAGIQNRHGVPCPHY
jgi:hypothetical protein